MSIKKLALLAGLGLITYHTNPTREDFDQQFTKHVKKENGAILSFVAKGVLYLTDLVDFATTKPIEANDYKRDLLAVGIFGKWIFVRDIKL
ncbi:hypothetical protein DFA_05920 [Cavenderia fasciculata]|uniref:Uncharacterized protein n=1 Tax=Cavenderia fasciculata TaxID=261658 RepID=F4PJL0_CACFS|nr:uncharacterized protein DFA_05920 [Cavenderia fasciculata]EGG23784.1 hypothetical protein DFA_05920 [Cavenderia fasciculata]|eukprot:XP_004361635.1 hypothetical protein DFA_05920 [Cavenderia fasciculata]